MNSLFRLGAIVVLALSAQSVLGQQTPSPPAKESQPTQAAATPEEFDKQLAKIREQMNKMDEQMTEIGKAQDPQKRQQLLKDHWATMQNAMGMMHEMWGSGASGSQGKGGHMMSGAMMGGPMMMWGDYRNLTPDQLKQRQYMMDQWMPMQQMMMNHMMQQQNWMMQPPPAAPPRK